MPDIFIEFGEGSTEFLDELKKADSEAQVSKEEKLVGHVDELIRVGLTLTPAVAFVIGRYFSYLQSKVLEFTVRDPEGQVIAAKGEGAERVLEYLKDKHSL